jgi:hypothetical protein
MMGMITEYSAAVLVAWSLFVLLVGYLWGSRKAKQPADDRARLDRPPPSPPLPLKPLGPSDLSPKVRTEIEEALRYGRKIEAIKIMREQTGMSLAEAKEAVEAMER